MITLGPFRLGRKFLPSCMYVRYKLTQTSLKKKSVFTIDNPYCAAAYGLILSLIIIGIIIN